MKHLRFPDLNKEGIPRFSDAQARKLARVYGANRTSPEIRSYDELMIALVTKQFLEPDADGMLVVSALGFSVLALHFAKMANKLGAPTGGVPVEGEAA